MKDKLWIIILAVLIIGGVIWLVAIQKDSAKSEHINIVDAKKFHQAYPSVPEKNRFVFATDQKILEIFEKGTGLVFLGFPDCPWCQELAPLVNQAAEDAGLEKIYYLDIQAARTNSDDTYKKLVFYLEDELSKDEDGNPRIYVPDLTAISNGQIVGRFKQEPTEEKLTPAQYWTTERKQSAIEQITQMIEKMSQSKFSQIETAVNSGNATLIDVRSPEEFSAGHFPGAINLDVEEIATGSVPQKPKDSKIYLYCRSGNRSSQAASMLKKEGFTNIEDLGGLSSVEALGGKLVRN